jgi:hypothetical protein
MWNLNLSDVVAARGMKIAVLTPGLEKIAGIHQREKAGSP